MSVIREEVTLPERITSESVLDVMDCGQWMTCKKVLERYEDFYVVTVDFFVFFSVMERLVERRQLKFRRDKEGNNKYQKPPEKVASHEGVSEEIFCDSGECPFGWDNLLVREAA